MIMSGKQKKVATKEKLLPIRVSEGVNNIMKYKEFIQLNKGLGKAGEIAIERYRKMIQTYALQTGINQAVREFECARNTVRGILRHGPAYRSRARKTQPQKISQELEDQILIARVDKGMGKNNIPKQYNLPVSESTVGRVLKRRGKDLPKKFRVNARRRKWRQTKDLRETKKTYKPFQCCSIDAKVLWDIKPFYKYLKTLMIPKVQVTFTCQRTGATFIAYGSGETILNICTFVVYIFEHLKRYGIDVKEIRLRHDGGSAYIGNAKSFQHSLFRILVRDIYQGKPRRIVHKNQNSEVERYHGLIEQYFYSIQHIQSRDDFFKQATNTQVWFNYIRKNSYKDWKTPVEILKEDYPDMDPQVLALPPIELDNYQDMYFFKKDPNHKPLTKELFFQDSDPWLVENIESEAFKSDIDFWVGWPNDSDPASAPKGGQHVLDLDESRLIADATF